MAAHADAGSFDSVNGFESESIHYAQDDKTKGNDLDVFRTFLKTGQRLAEIHVHYEQQPKYKLTKGEKAGEKLDYRVTKMKLSKDKTTLIYNQFLTLSGIPKKPTTTASATAPHWNGSSINTKSQPTSGAASPTIQTAPTTHNTSSASSAKSLP